MANNKIWSEQRKEYLKSLIPYKKIQFAVVNGSYIATLEDVGDNYDIIIGLTKNEDVYYAFDAKLHKNRKTASLDCFDQKTKSKKQIAVGYRKIADNYLLYERVFRIPNSCLEEFTRRIDYYIDRFEIDKCDKSLGYYDEKTKSIVKRK